MEPTTLATATIAALFTSEAIKAGGKAFGEGTSKLVGKLLIVIRNKFKNAEMEGLLKRVEKKPTKSNVKRFEAELLTHIEEDEEFASQLRELLMKSEAVEVVRQMGAENIKASGNLDIKEISQKARGGKAVKQVGVKDVEVGGDAKFGKINQRN